MTDLNALKSCEACTLSTVRRQVVLGRGTIPAAVLVIGEAPGRSEDMLGQAFIGEAGRLLDQLLDEAGIDLDTVYRTNTVLCRPSDKFGGDNREPKPEEVLACMNNVLLIVSVVNPMWIILVGDTAKRNYHKHFPGAVHITHPAALLRTGGRASPGYIMNLRALQLLSERIKQHGGN